MEGNESETGRFSFELVYSFSFVKYNCTTFQGNRMTVCMLKCSCSDPACSDYFFPSRCRNESSPRLYKKSDICLSVPQLETILKKGKFVYCVYYQANKDIPLS